MVVVFPFLKSQIDDLRPNAGVNDRSLNWHRADLIQEEELA